MSQDIKTDLLPKLRARYERRSREGKTRMLDELCEDYGYERKYAIKLLGDRLLAPSGRKHPGPEPRYGLIEPVVRTIWLAAEQPCGKRLAPASPLWLRHYEPARTAYQRLITVGVLGRQARRELRERYESLGPFVWKREVERRLKPILTGVAEVVRGPAGGSASR